MHTIIHYSSVLLMLFITVSCSNALYFYETDKVSLTIEARPDSTQPVQGNFGLKQRLALVTPGIKNETGNAGEALSAVNSFRFHKAPVDFPSFGPVSIKTAFITGEAASTLGNKAVGAATAIVGGTNNDIDTDIAIISSIITRLENDTENRKAVELLNQLEELGKTIVPDKYPLTLYGVKANEPLGCIEIEEGHKINTSTSPKNSTALEKNISGALKYLDQLDNGAKTLKFALNTPKDYCINGVILNDVISINGLRSILTQTEAESLKVRRELVSSPVYSESIRFYLKNYL